MAEHGTRSRYISGRCRCEACTEAQRVYNQKWAERNRDKQRANARRYRARNPESVREAARLRRLANLEAERARGRRYRQAHPEVEAERGRRKRDAAQELGVAYDRTPTERLADERATSKWARWTALEDDYLVASHLSLTRGEMALALRRTSTAVEYRLGLLRRAGVIGRKYALPMKFAS